MSENINHLTLIEYLKRPDVKLIEISKILNIEESFEVLQQVEIQIKYEGYIKKQLKDAQEQAKLENFYLPNNLDYNKIDHLALEARQKLQEIKPETLGQASRISGVNPSDINALLIHLRLGK